jgi:DNA-binding NarL/FixJ family response regulator
VRAVARTLLRAHGFNVVGEASNGPDGALLASEHQPTVVVLDQRMPAMSGEHTARLLRRVSPASLIVVFSAVLDRRPPWADASVRKDEADRLPDVVASVTRASANP